MKKKILLAEDNEFITELMTHALTKNGFEVMSVTNGGEVIDKVKDENPDLVILDACLPDIDGRVICQQLKTALETQHLPVIMCSGRDDIGESLKQEGAPNDILAKPFNLKFLVEKINGFLKVAA
jgi:DNA-binding response OmpR family regulator